MKIKSCAYLMISIIAANSCFAQICAKPFHILVLGSSTAAGDGASSYAHAWVGRFTDSLQKINVAYVVDNLAVAGTTTYDAQPNDYTPPAGRPVPLVGHNITAALKLHPDAIIINYPSNDVVDGFSLKEQKSNFKRITNKADSANVLVWISTPQPRNNLTQPQINSQLKLMSWIEDFYKEKSMNFWNGLTSAKDSILFEYNSGDGIHLNNAGHNTLYHRVLKENIPDSLCIKSNTVPLAFFKRRA